MKVFSKVPVTHQKLIHVEVNSFVAKVYVRGDISEYVIGSVTISLLV